jgi:hypothetical protein
MPYYRLLLIVCRAFLLCALLSVAGTPIWAQAPNSDWSPPRELTRLSDDGELNAEAPILAGDSEGTAHLFWVYQDIIYYMRRNSDGWSKPRDVLLTPGGGPVHSPHVVIDQSGYMHVLWWGVPKGGTDTIYYSRAPVGQAQNASAWSRPTVLFSLGGNPFAVPYALALAPDNGLHALVVFPQGSRFELYHVSSTDQGAHWSAPAPISASVEQYRPGTPGLAIGPDGVLHAVWTELPEFVSTPPKRSIYYSQSRDNGRTWSTPFELGRRSNYDFANIVARTANELMVVWEGSAPEAGRWYRRSIDHGATWTAAQAIAPFIGLTGSAQLTVDTAGVVHLVVSANGLGQTAGLFHWRWVNATWGDATAIAPDLSGEYPSATLVNGNELVLAWTGAGYARQGIWFTTFRTGAPPLPNRPVPTPAPVPTIVNSAAAAATPDNSAGAVATRGAQPDGTAAPATVDELSGATSPLLAGIIPVVLLILAVVAARVMAGRR